MPGRFFGVILFVTVILSGTLYGDINILTNPGFESGTTTGWSGRSCTISASTVQKRSGSYSGLTSGRTQTWQGIKQSILGLLNNGQTCTISGYVMLAGSTASDTVKLTVEKKDSGGTQYISIQSKTGTNTGWTQLSGSFTLDTPGSLTLLDIYFEGPASGVNFYVDDAAVMTTVDTDIAGQINPLVHYQHMEGFGAAGAWYQGNLVNHSQKTTLYNLLFRDLGLDIYQIRNTYQIDAANIDNDQTIINQARAVLDHPLKIMISSWSPPASLKSNSNTREGTLAKNTSGQYRYGEFAQWWRDSLTEYAAHGIVPDYINMQNEPDYTNSGWDTCKFAPSETTEWAGYNLAFDALADAVSGMTNAPKLLAPEAVGFGASQSYINALLDRTPVYAYAHHLYGDGSGGSPDNYISGMTSFATQYNDKPRMQTEFSYTGDTGVFADAMNLALLMHNSLTAESVSAYLYWDLFWGTSPSGLITIPNTSSYTTNPIYYAFKHYSAYIDADWRRVSAATDATGLRISAYASPDNHSMTAVIINPLSTSYNLTFTPNQFSFTSGSIYRSSATENAALIGPFNPAQPLTIPASSITTITMSGTIIPASCAQVQDFGYRLSGDLDGNCHVELADLLLLANQWLSTNPTAVAPNYSPDVVADDKVTLADFAVIAGQWLACNDPADATCTQNW